MRNFTFASAALAGAMILLGSGCNKLKSRDDINKGIAAYRNAKYSDAVELFKEAMELDPTNPSPQIYLATAYMMQWIPGAESPENAEFAAKAKAEFLKVLEKEPNEKVSLAYLASLAYNSAQSMTPDKKLEALNEAVTWYKKLIDVDPKNKEAYYSLGVISWAKWYPALMTARTNLRMKPEDPGPIKDKKVKETLKAQYSPIIEDGIQNLQKALDIDKEYDDAMAYMNLLVRERADLVDTPDQYKKEVEVADSWVQKALDTKKIKAARQPQTGGIVQEK
jgi:tetratricopeptide (TPR) repeat protein